jgi:hypothetical protein
MLPAVDTKRKYFYEHANELSQTWPRRFRPAVVDSRPGGNRFLGFKAIRKLMWCVHYWKVV